MSTKKVLVALSGGVDSSVAVHLLRQQGYEVEGIILEFSPVHKAAVQAAQVIADQLDVKLHVVECHKEFEQNVILPFCREYQAGRTPNPCIFCNPTTKFGIICQFAKEHGFDKIATGHYARVEHLEDGTAVLKKSACIERDQSYMLYRLTQEQLSMLILPLEGLEKTEVRQIARDFGLASADAPDSQKSAGYRTGITLPLLSRSWANPNPATSSPRMERSAASTKVCSTIRSDRENALASL